MPGQRRDALVQLRVVLHRARPERIEAGVEVEVALAQPVVVPHDLRLGDLRQSRRLGPPKLGGNQLVERTLGHVERRRRECAATWLGALEDRQLVVGSLDERLGAVVGGGGHASASSMHSASLSICVRVRLSVIATSSHCSVARYPGLMPARLQWAMTSSNRPPSIVIANSRTTGWLWASDTPGIAVEPLARVGGALRQQLRELDQPAPSEPAQVDDPGERVQRLRRADIRRRLLAADVLLTRLQREHISKLAVQIVGLPGDPAGNSPSELLGDGKEAERRPAEVEAVAKGLALADDDVHPLRARRLQQPKRDRVSGADHQRAQLMCGADDRLQPLDRAQEVRLGDDQGADILVEPDAAPAR